MRGFFSKSSHCEKKYGLWFDTKLLLTVSNCLDLQMNDGQQGLADFRTNFRTSIFLLFFSVSIHVWRRWRLYRQKLNKLKWRGRWGKRVFCWLTVRLFKNTMIFYSCVFSVLLVFPKCRFSSILFFCSSKREDWFTFGFDSLFLFRPVYLLLIDMFIMQVLCLKNTMIYFISCFLAYYYRYPVYWAHVLIIQAAYLTEGMIWNNIINIDIRCHKRFIQKKQTKERESENSKMLKTRLFHLSIPINSTWASLETGPSQPLGHPLN